MSGIVPALLTGRDSGIEQVVEPDEVAEVVAAVSDDAWSFVNGAYLPVDGGYLSR